MRVCGPKAGSKVVSVPRKGALSPPRPAALGCAKARWPPGELTLPLAERAVEEDLQTHTGERPESGEEWPRSQKGAAPAESSLAPPDTATLCFCCEPGRLPADGGRGGRTSGDAAQLRMHPLPEIRHTEHA